MCLSRPAKWVADVDRKIAEEEAEEEERRRESEREHLLQQLGACIEDTFDFTSKEKLELQPRLDVQDGIGVLEFLDGTRFASSAS
jgi:hypothetical protein